MKILRDMLSAAILATLWPICVHAAGSGIVYSARYYNPPGSEGTSHFHIYRIQPDGTHKRQLTFGTDDEEGPQWSPDGKNIVFLRQSDQTDIDKLCIVSAVGGAVRTLGTYNQGDFRWIGTNHVAVDKDDKSYRSYDIGNGTSAICTANSASIVSPDGRHKVCKRGKDVVIVNRTGSQAVIPPAALDEGLFEPDQILWLDNSKLIVLGPQGDATDNPNLNEGTYSIIGVNGKILRTAHFKIGKAGHGHYYPGYGDFRSVMPYHGRSAAFIAVENWHNSTVGDDNGYYRVDAASGKTDFLSEGRFLVWSPSGRRYIVAPGRDTTHYAKRADATCRLVWFAPLFVVDPETGFAHQITPRLSYVTSADWR